MNILAIEFSKILHEWLNQDTIDQINSLNEAQEDKDICHSHDFCDANMAMNEAFQKVYGRGLNLGAEEELSITSKSWKLAKENEFDFCLFRHNELQPEELKQVLSKYSQESEMEYEELERMLNECNSIGYTFEYYLDGTPFNLKTID